MKSVPFILLLLLISIPLYAQKEAAIWYFGNNAGLDFNSGNPVALTDGALKTNEGCATISNKDGQLLFYTDGSFVYNKNHQIMPNGSGLMGNRSSTQSAIIVPKPRNPYVYYIFTVDEPNDLNTDNTTSNDRDPPNNGLNYSQVDMRLNNGLGDVVASEKNVHLITYNPTDNEEVKFKCSEKITAVQHGDGISYWVITHFIDNFYSFKVDTQGVKATPVKTKTTLNIPIGGYLVNAIGYLKASPNGKKIVIANNASRRTNETGPRTQNVRNTGNVLLYDFDALTGTISNELRLISNSNPYGVEFSSKTKKLYVTENHFDATGEIITESALIQFDLKNPNILSSKTIIETSAGFISGALQLAIDEKIYRAGYFTSGSTRNMLSVINNPELDGINCNYAHNAIDLKTGITQQGLPPFITSLFLYSFQYEFNCLGDATHFFINTVEKIDSVIWDFGDGSTSNELDTHHIYENIGDYLVTLTKVVNGETRDPIEKTVTIYETPVISPDPIKLTQCDTQDTNPTDGLSLFNLELANEAISLGNQNYEIFYYNNLADAENDLNNTESINTLYRNQVPDEQLYAKVIQSNSDCYSIGLVILHANENLTLAPTNLHGCDLGEGMALFDLEKQTQVIKTELNLPQDVRLLFYSNKDDAAIGKNVLENQYTSYSKTLYLRAENDEGCYGTGQFDIIVEPIPNIKTYEKITLCEGSEYSITLLPGIEFPSQTTDYTYEWSTGESSPSIVVTKEGKYTVLVKSKSGCSVKRTCDVNLSRLAQIKNISIQDLVPINYVAVEVSNPENYRYKIQFENGTATPFQNLSVFVNVPGGFHELIIENIDGCGLVKRSFAVLEASSFFTPNGDGTNDYWNLRGLDDSIYKNAVISIFDRYGKLLKQLNPSSIGWDGNYNGQPLPSDDYWFTIKLDDNRNAKGHFSLKR
jgi:gliding motility-associated-like protein